MPDTGCKGDLIMEKGSRPTAAFIGVLLGGFVLYYTMTAVQEKLTTVMFDYAYWWQQIEHNPLYRFFWMIGDATEPQFHKTLLGGVGVTAGSFIAYYLDRKNSPLAGTPICYGTGKWPWLFAASVLSLGIAVILFGGLRIEDGWVGTFVPYVSVAGAIILIYGGSVTNVFTAAVLSALFTTPITTFIRHFICAPWELPGVIGSVGGMWIVGILVCELCRFLPWMKVLPGPVRSPAANPFLSKEYKQKKANTFFLRRMLADYSEPVFMGNEIAGAMLVAGSFLTWLISPMQPYYGTGWFPALVLGQIITGSVCIYVYWNDWVENDFFPSFVPVMSVSPSIILVFGPSMFVVVCSAVLGALLTPPVADMVNRGMPAHRHPMIGFTFSMAVCTFAVTVLIKYLLMAFPGLAG
jgi:hypothetical protein